MANRKQTLMVLCSAHREHHTCRRFSPTMLGRAGAEAKSIAETGNMTWSLKCKCSIALEMESHPFCGGDMNLMFCTVGPVANEDHLDFRYEDDDSVTFRKGQANAKAQSHKVTAAPAPAKGSTVNRERSPRRDTKSGKGEDGKGEFNPGGKGPKKGSK